MAPNRIASLTLPTVVLLLMAFQSWSQCVQQVNFNNWEQTGDYAGQWQIQSAGSQLYTIPNTNYPTVFVGPDTLINVKITGSFKVEDTSDDDYVGFVFGFKETWGETWGGGSGVANMQHEYYLFDWKKNSQTYSGYSAQEGFTLDKVNGTFNYSFASVFPSFWSHSNSTAFNVLATSYSATNGWVANTTYDFELFYTPTRAVIKIDTDTIFDITGCFEPGLFGFYNYSQRYARYWNFNYELYVDFQMEYQNICIGDTARFTFIDTSSCSSANTFTNLDTFYWDLGDGTITGDTNPTHIYSDPGSYLVSLIATDVNNCQDTMSRTIYVQEEPEVIIDVDNVCRGTAMQFGDSTSMAFGAINSWEWDFGDGSASSSQQHPAHNYSQPGTYTVSLGVGSNGGCASDTTVDVEVYPLPYPEFTFSNECEGISVPFEDQSVEALGPITSVEWDVQNDGTYDYTGQTAGNTYSIHGTYTVQLRVTDSLGCQDSTLKLITVHPLPNADFTVPGTCFNEASVFSDASTVASGAIASWNWDFGDNSNGVGSGPSHVYASPGFKNAELTVTTDSGCVDSTTKQLVVYELPVADFTADPACENLPAAFVQNSVSNSGYLVQYNWLFGDGGSSTAAHPSHDYSQPGLYTVDLEVLSNYGCYDTVQHSIRIYPAPQAAFAWPNNICEGEPMPFDDQSIIVQATPGGDSITAWEWTINKDLVLNQQNPVYQTNTYESIEVRLIVESNYGCLDSITNNPFVFDIPNPEFTVDIACEDRETQFEDVSVSNSGIVDQWFWNFGDGIISFDERPAHKYALPGDYEVTFAAITNKGCTDTLVRSIYIPETPSVSFKSIPSTGCAPVASRMVNFSQVSRGELTYQWFVNGVFTSTDENPSILFHNDTLIPRPHAVRLIATSEEGCQGEFLDPEAVVVLPAPKADFSIVQSNVDLFEPLVQVNNTSQKSIRWYWSFGDGFTSRDFQPEHAYESSGSYDIRLVSWNEYSCTDTVYKRMEVEPITTLYIPNSFTPNGDGVNDEWDLSGFNEGNEFHIRIWNRWGELLMEDNTMDFKWSGHMPNSTELAPVGVYVYEIHFFTSSGNYRELHGEINLLR